LILRRSSVAFVRCRTSSTGAVDAIKMCTTELRRMQFQQTDHAQRYRDGLLGSTASSLAMLDAGTAVKHHLGRMPHGPSCRRTTVIIVPLLDAKRRHAFSKHRL